ncbi:MAG: hypothetical protein ACRCXB_22940 [Aeromonadaceae bacterium]
MTHPLRTAVIATNVKTGEKLHFKSIQETARSGFTYSSVRNALRTGHTHAGFTFKASGPQRALKVNNLIQRVANLRNKGKSNPEIAEALNIQRGTVGCYASIAHKMGLTLTYAEVQENLECDGKL